MRSMMTARILIAASSTLARFETRPGVVGPVETSAKARFKFGDPPDFDFCVGAGVLAPALALASVIAIFSFLPDALRVLPLWVTIALGVAVLVPIIAAGLPAAHQRWFRIEHAVVLIFLTVAVALLLGNLANLVGAIIYRSAQTTGLQLLTSGIELWVSNVIMFSLLYWQIDRGGPDARASDRSRLPDWIFPRESTSSADASAVWWPTFVDYLYLSYATASACPTDTVPSTARAKMLMMLESLIALGTIVLIASRAINILGS